MTTFEMRGVELQHNSASRIDAENRFAHSCDICCTRGMHVRCDSCAISYAHKSVIDIFDAMNTNTGLRMQYNHA